MPAAFTRHQEPSLVSTVTWVPWAMRMSTVAEVDGLASSGAVSSSPARLTMAEVSALVWAG